MVKPLVMGVLNVTPDSFFDGGRYLQTGAAIERGRAMAAEGADIIDIGGESTRPGAQPVPEDEELRRVLPVVASLAGTVRISIDTMKPAVAMAAIAEGASLLNDVGGALGPIAAEQSVGLVVMHRQGMPQDMQRAPHYDDVVGEVHAALAEGATAARSLGVGELYVDPGIGFGKTAAHNLALLAALSRLVAAGEPVLVGASRKSFLGVLAAPAGAAPRPPQDRLPGSLAVASWAMLAGAAIVRVHDVRATVQARELAGPRLCTLGPVAISGAGR